MENRFVIDKDELIKLYADILRKHFGDNLNLSAGSILGNLIRSLAEIDNNLLFYFSYLLNESNIYTAVLPRSIYLLARQLGYIPSKGKPLELKARILLQPPKENRLYQFNLTKNSQFELSITTKHKLPLQLKYNYKITINGLYCTVENLDLHTVDIGHIIGINDDRPIYSVVLDFEQAEYRDYSVPADTVLTSAAYIQTVRLPKEINKNVVDLQLDIEFTDNSRTHAKLVDNFDGLMHNEFTFTYDDYGEYLEVYLSPYFAQNVSAIKQLHFKLKESHTGVAELLDIKDNSQLRILIGNSTVIDTISQSYAIHLYYDQAMITQLPKDRDTVDSIRYNILRTINSTNILYSIKDLEKTVNYNTIFRIYKTGLFSDLVLYASPVKSNATDELVRSKLINAIYEVTNPDEVPYYLTNPVLGNFVYSNDDKLVAIYNTTGNLNIDSYASEHITPLIVYYDEQFSELKHFKFNFEEIFKPQSNFIRITDDTSIIATLLIDTVDLASGELVAKLYITTSNLELENIQTQLQITDNHGNSYIVLTDSIVLPSQVIDTGTGLKQYIFELPIFVESNYLKHFESTNLNLAVKMYTEIGDYNTVFNLNILQKVDDFQLNIDTSNVLTVDTVTYNKFVLTNIDSQTAVNNLFAVIREPISTDLLELGPMVIHYSNWSLHFTGADIVRELLNAPNFAISLAIEFLDNTHSTSVFTLEKVNNSNYLYIVKLADNNVGYAKLINTGRLYNTTHPSAETFALHIYFNDQIVNEFLRMSGKSLADIKRLQIVVSDSTGNKVLHYITNKIDKNYVTYPMFANVRNVPVFNIQDISIQSLTDWYNYVMEHANEVSLLYKLRVEPIIASKILIHIELVGPARTQGLILEDTIARLQYEIKQLALQYIIDQLQQLNDIKLSGLHSKIVEYLQHKLPKNINLQYSIDFLSIRDGQSKRLQLSDIIAPDLAVIYPYKLLYKKHIEYPIDIDVEIIKQYAQQ